MQMKQNKTRSERQMSMGELCMAWQSAACHQVKPSTYACYATMIQKHIEPFMGEVAVGELDNHLLTEFIEEQREKGLSGNTIRLILFILKRILRFGEVRGLFPAEPLEFALPRDKGVEWKLLSPKDRRRLLLWLSSCRTNFEAGLLLSICTGIRVGELCGLKWEDLDLERGILSVRRTVSRIRNTGEAEGAARTVLYIGSPKSGTSNRVIPLSAPLVERLYRVKKEEGVYLLTGTARCMEPRGVQRRFKNLLRKMNIQEVNIHSLRHAFASQWIENGFDSKSLSEILGHSSVKITLDIYVHSSMDRKKAMMDQMDLSME